jgi:ribosomal protein S18 acetylase RimI-like enzyme
VDLAGLDPVKTRIKNWLFRLLGKDPEAVVVSFCSGEESLARAMREEIQRLEPGRRHFQVHAGEPFRSIRKRFRGYRIGLAPVLFTNDADSRRLRVAAFLLAPRKILAYNARLERHHLSLTSPIASWLFLRGVPLDRVFLRPRWVMPDFFKAANDRTVRPLGHRVIEGRARRPHRRSVAVLTPYFPYPLAHGGAVRMFHLLRETAKEFDVVLYAFTEGEIVDADLKPVLEFVTRVYLVPKPRYREPRWSTVTPPEVCEYQSPEMSALLRARQTDLLQVEYTYLAGYGGDVLVEHDVTFDLYAQVRARRKTPAASWDYWRWHRYETRAVRRFRLVAVMSEKDRALLGIEHARVIENGVDLDRFQPRPETPGRRVLFIGSFRHFPNIVAFRFLTEEILPLVPGVEVTVVAGPEPWLHWRHYTGTLPPPGRENIQILEFVADVRPLYVEANVVAVPTLESAGTNVKVLEALAMERAVVSTASGCAGLGLKHGETAWVGDTAADFAQGIRTLLNDHAMRSRIAQAGRVHAERHFDWRAIGARQRAVFRELLGDPVSVRAASGADLPAIASIQAASPEASRWDPASYLDHDCRVAIIGENVVGFLVSRQTAPATAPGESEILNLAVDPSRRRQGIARRLLEAVLENTETTWFLEVRASNTAAVNLYKGLGFEASGRRELYYDNPPEAAIVMRFFSCYRHDAQLAVRDPLSGFE